MTRGQVVSVPLPGVGYLKDNIFYIIIDLNQISFSPVAGSWLFESKISTKVKDIFMFQSRCRELVI